MFIIQFGEIFAEYTYLDEHFPHRRPTVPLIFKISHKPAEFFCTECWLLQYFLIYVDRISRYDGLAMLDLLLIQQFNLFYSTILIGILEIALRIFFVGRKLRKMLSPNQKSNFQMRLT